MGHIRGTHLVFNHIPLEVGSRNKLIIAIANNDSLTQRKLFLIICNLYRLRTLHIVLWCIINDILKELLLVRSVLSLW